MTGPSDLVRHSKLQHPDDPPRRTRRGDINLWRCSRCGIRVYVQETPTPAHILSDRSYRTGYPPPELWVWCREATGQRQRELGGEP